MADIEVALNQFINYQQHFTLVLDFLADVDKKYHLTSAKNLLKYYGQADYYQSEYLISHPNCREYQALIKTTDILVAHRRLTMSMSQGLLETMYQRLPRPASPGEWQQTLQQVLENSSLANITQFVNGLLTWVKQADPNYFDQQRAGNQGSVKAKQPKSVSNEAHKKSVSKQRQPASAKKRGGSKKLSVVSPKIRQEIKEQQELLANRKKYTGELSKRAVMMLDTREGELKPDASFGKQHPLVFPLKPEYGLRTPLSEDVSSMAVGKVPGALFNDPQFGILQDLKVRFFQAGVFVSSHELDLAFNQQNGLYKVPYWALLYVDRLISHFSIDGDWSGLANVMHSVYAMELVYRRKLGWDKLGKLDRKNGLIDKFKSGDFGQQIPSRYRTAAFFYYVTRWAYLMADNYDRKEGSYLSTEEQQFSPETRHLIKLSREKDDQSLQDSQQISHRLATISGQQAEIIRQLDALRGLSGQDLTTNLYMLEWLIRTPAQRDDMNKQLTNVNDNDPISRDVVLDDIRKIVNNQRVEFSPISRVVQQQVPTLSKRASEYRRTEKQRRR